MESDKDVEEKSRQENCPLLLSSSQSADETLNQPDAPPPQKEPSADHGENSTTSIRSVARRGNWRRGVQQPYQRPHLSQVRFLVKEETSKVQAVVVSEQGNSETYFSFSYDLPPKKKVNK